jgi:two-component system, cell cycle response regulator
LADLTEAVGVSAGLAGDQLMQLRQATLVHRVGLSAVPRTILDKRTPLTDEEQEFLARHTAIAERVLAAAPSLRAVAVLVRATGEAFDGSGGPDGLSGDSIPFASRIIAVCAAYAALTNARPYRLAVSHSMAVRELRRCAGTQFDPAVVAALEEVLRSRRDAERAVVPSVTARPARDRVLRSPSR